MSLARFFALHYGIFTLVHGVFAIIMAALVGLTGGIGQVGLLSRAITASHLFSLGVNWFGRDERMVVSPGQAMFAPYPRMLVLHVGIIIAFGVVLVGWEHGENGNDQVTAVAVLCAMKLLVDLGFHLWQHRSRQASASGRRLRRTSRRGIGRHPGRLHDGADDRRDRRPSARPSRIARRRSPRRAATARAPGAWPRVASRSAPPSS